MTKHTPGPWGVEPATWDGWYVTGPPAGEPLRDLRDRPECCTFANLADARLIAAAPELREKLERVYVVHGGAIAPELTSDILALLARIEGVE